MDKIRQILNWLEEYKNATNCKGVVLGISGGKDSTVVAMLAKKVWGDNVVGIMMPNGDQRDLMDSIEICNTVGIKHTIINIGSLVRSLVDAVNNSAGLADVSQKASTNIPPRLRMTILYAVAQSMGYRVIGTGNASEAFIGWTTKWGDSAYDLNPIYHLTCTEVVEIGRELAKEFGLNQKYVDKSPSDGLTGRTDEDNFGFTYSDLDAFINGVMPDSDEVLEKIIDMHAATAHKREMPLCIRKVE